MIDPSHLHLLQELSADENAHSGRTLLDHLRGTYDLLVAWGNTDDVCVGGLFHSIYGTEYYTLQSASLDRRAEVAAIIGERAEQLAYLFCATSRPEFFDQAGAAEPVLTHRADQTPIPVTPATIDALIEIEVANLVEQLDPTHLTPEHTPWLHSMLARGQTHMTTKAQAALAQLASK